MKEPMETLEVQSNSETKAKKNLEFKKKKYEICNHGIWIYYRQPSSLTHAGKKLLKVGKLDLTFNY